ncbi:MAG TPA: TetR/AcrR family transcriptional regulator [Acidimicrobiales bacterium]
MPQRSSDTPAPGRRLDRAAWAAAALDALSTGGIAAVAVEPIAARLGATKGSFYWHFPSRDALVEAALDLHARRSTDDVIAELDALDDPAQRLVRLFDHVFRRGHAGRAELALLSHADDRLVAPVLARMTRRRVDYLDRLYRDLGLPDAEARRYAVLAYTAYTGVVQAQRAAGGRLFGSAAERSAYVDFLLPMLTPRRPE